MGAGSSVAQSAENSSNSTTAVSFSDDEFHILIESFFDFYKHARRSGKDHSTIKSHSLWNFDRFESIPNDVISSYEHSNSTCIEQKIRIEYFRSISTIHPLRVRQHLFEYISSGILGIIGIEYDNLLAIMNRHEDQIKSLISATENLNLDSVDIQARKCTTISFTSSQETLLHTAIKRLDGSCEETEKECLLRNNSFPSHVFDFISYSLDGRRNFENEARKILIAYYLIFRGKLLPVILSLKNEILEWARKYDSDHSSANLTPCDDLPSPPIPAPAAVMGVSLRFLKEFIISNTIPSDMLTAKVVSDVIVPQTSATKETFINAHLLPTPHVVSDLRKGYNKNKKVLTVLGNGMCSEFDGFYCFLSHAWSMPFSELLCIAERAANVHFKSKTDMLTRICSPDDVLDCSFFWIDVFCKNQHIPAPAMDEFHQALKAPEVAVIALFPREPIAFQRIWCLFEIWTAVVNNITILPTMSEEAFSYFSANAKANFDSKPKLRVPVPAGDSTTIQLRKTVTEEFKASFMEEMKEKVIVRVEDSKATVPADIDTIMALIRQSTSVGKLNEDIFKAVCDTMWVRIESEYGYSKAVFCFDGDGVVSMWDGSTKRVRDMLIGDVVMTVEGKRAEIALITCDEVDSSVGADLCNFKGMWITPEHPILWHHGLQGHNSMETEVEGSTQSEWVMPKAVLEVQRVYSVSALYNFELSPGASSVVINGVGVITLGQEIGFEPISDALYGWGWKTNHERQRYLPRSIAT